MATLGHMYAKLKLLLLQNPPKFYSISIYTLTLPFPKFNQSFSIFTVLLLLTELYQIYCYEGTITGKYYIDCYIKVFQVLLTIKCLHTRHTYLLNPSMLPNSM